MRIAVVGHRSPRPIGVAQVISPGVLPAIGLEPVDAHLLQQVPSLRQPPGLRIGVGPIRQQGAREPPATVPIRPTVRLANRVASLDSSSPGHVAPGFARGCRALLPAGCPGRTRGCPEQSARASRDRAASRPGPWGQARPRRTVEPEVGQPVGSAVRVRGVSGVTEGDEGRLVAPRLDHQDTGRDVLGDLPLDLPAHTSVGVPQSLPCSPMGERVSRSGGSARGHQPRPGMRTSACAGAAPVEGEVATSAGPGPLDRARPRHRGGRARSHRRRTTFARRCAHGSPTLPSHRGR